MSVALIKFTQGGNVGSPGRALIGSRYDATINNSDNTNVASWQIDLVWKPIGSALTLGTLAFNNNGNTPTANFTPDMPGSYRFVLSTWDIINRVGIPTDKDIRVFAVPDPVTGIIKPPMQVTPRPLPSPDTGLAGAKEYEMNFNGYDHDWAGNACRYLINNAFSQIDVPFVAGTGTQPPIVGAINYSNANGFSFGLSASNVITGSYTVPSTAGLISRVNISGGTTSNNLSNIIFSNSNNVSFGLNGSTMTGSIPVQSNQTIGLFAVGNTTQNSSTTLDARTFSIQGAGIASVGYSAGSLVISVPSVAPPSINFSAGTTSTNLSSVVFSNSNRISFGLNGATITGSIPTEFTKSKFNPFMEAVAVVGQHGQGSLHFHPVPDPSAFQFDRMLFDIHFTGNITNATVTSTQAISLTMQAGIFTRNVSTLSLLASGSTSTAFTIGTTNSNLFVGGRLLSMGWTTTIPTSDLWLGIVSSTNSAGVNSATISQYVVSDIGTNFSGMFGVASNATCQDALGLGYYTAVTNGIPSSVAFSQINGTASMVLRPPLYRFLSQTA